MDAWKQDLQKQSQDTEKLGSPRLADTNQDKLSLAQSRLMEASPEVLTLAQQRIHRSVGTVDITSHRHDNSRDRWNVLSAGTWREGWQ